MNFSFFTGRNIFLIFAGSTQLVAFSAHGASWADSIRLEIDAKVAQHFQNRSQVGIALGVITSTQKLSWGYGETSIGSGIQPGSDHFFEIGSITKTYTTTLLALETVRGRVALTDPVKLFWPELTGTDAGEIPLEGLATHHSGLPRMPDNFAPADPSNPFKDYDRDRLLSFLKNFKQTKKGPYPYAYSNVGMGLLGYLLSEKLHQISYEKYLDENLLLPLGLTDTKVKLEPKDLLRGAQGHNALFELVPFWDLNVLDGAGVLKSTVSDLLKYIDINMSEDLGEIGQAMRLAHLPRADSDQPNTKVGLGWHLSPLGHYSVTSHSGATGGYRANLVFDPKKKLGAVVLSNMYAAQNCVLAPVFEAECEVPKWTQVDPKLQSQMLGRYYSESAKLGIEILFQNGTFGLAVEGQQKVRLWANSDLEYEILEAAASITFSRSSQGQFNHFTLKQNGESIEFLRQ